MNKTSIEFNHKMTKIDENFCKARAMIEVLSISQEGVSRVGSETLEWYTSVIADLMDEMEPVINDLLEWIPCFPKLEDTAAS